MNPPVPVWRRALLQVLLVLFLSIGPLLVYRQGWKDGKGFAGMPLFGSHFHARALPEIREVGVPVFTEFGYDGQFYAQIALDPLLKRDEELRAALDTPDYRSYRVLVPTLAALAGGGDVLRTLNAYSLLNLVAWIALLAFLLVRFQPLGLRGAAVIVAILLTQGVFSSMVRALTDLPATALMVATVLSAGLLARTGWFAAAMLSRETALFSALGAIDLRSPKDLLRPRTWLPVVVACALFGGWFLYVKSTFPGVPPPSSGNFAPPLVGFFQKVMGAGNTFFSTPDRYRLFELLAPLSLAAQVLYVALNPRLQCRVWRMAVMWALLFTVIGSDIWVEQHAFTRVLLPLTVSFNLLLALHPHERSRWIGWFVAGNAGLAWHAVNFYLL